MPSGESTDTRGLLNGHTLIVHRARDGDYDLESDCGHTGNLPEKQLLTVPIPVATDQSDVSKCGNCFEDGGGY